MEILAIITVKIKISFTFLSPFLKKKIENKRNLRKSNIKKTFKKKQNILF
jgi:hypothetical protein